jgi:hypothetical protein
MNGFPMQREQEARLKSQPHPGSRWKTRFISPAFAISNDVKESKGLTVLQFSPFKISSKVAAHCVVAQSR